MLPDESRRGEEGFTLIELLVAIMVSGLILSAITTGFITAVRGTAGAHDRFVASNAAQTLATYFTSDVQSANPAMVSTASADPTGCSTTPAGTNVLRLQWSQIEAGGTASKMSAFSVAYRMQQPAGPGSEWQLARYYCTGFEDPVSSGATVSSILSSHAPTSHVVAHDLSDPTNVVTFNDGVLTSGSPVITSASAKFTSADVDGSITGTGIPANTKIVAVNAANNVTVSAGSTATASGASINITRYKPAVSVVGQRITLKAFAALSAGQSTPYFYNLSASMRTPVLFPHVTSIIRANPDPTMAASVRWTVTFSEAVTGVDDGDFTLAQAGISGASISPFSGSGTTFTVTANTGSGNGTLGLNLADNDTIVNAGLTKLGGAGFNNGDFAGQIYTVDKLAPTVTVNKKVGQADPTATLPILFTVPFSEPVTGFDTTDVTRTGTAPGGTVSVTPTDTTGQNYEISVTGLTGDGTVIVSIGAGRAIDLAGNPNAASTTTPVGDNRATYSNVPTASSINRAGATPTSSASVQWTVTFSKPVTGVDPDDFTLVTTGGISGASITGVTGIGTTYTVTVNRGTGLGTIGLNLVDDDSIEDSTNIPLGGAGLGNGNANGQTYQIVHTISSVQLRNGGSANTVDKGDQIVVTFSESMKVSSFCSTWTSGDGNNQSLGNAAVTLADGAPSLTTNDSISVSTPTCAFNFGSIDLGSGDYVSGSNAVFSGGGPNASTIDWNASARTLTITLGKANGGTVASVTGSTPIYTASPSIQNSAGTGVTNSPFSLPPGAQF
jgi:prepilin-type N-terminal cleavage/methylation domain-containing protein